MPHSTCKEQFLLLSSISNYHWIENVALFTNKTFKSKNRFSNHMTYFMPQDGGTKCQKHHIPTSPRNWSMHMVLDDNYESSICDVIKHLLHFDKHPHEHMAPSANDEDSDEPPQKKTRRQAPKVISVLPTSVCKEIGVDYNAILNSAKEERSMYTKFQEELLVDGTIKWHLHSETRDICVMSDINSSTGALIPSSFVHITCMKIENDNSIITCTCDHWSRRWTNFSWQLINLHALPVQQRLPIDLRSMKKVFLTTKYMLNPGNALKYRNHYNTWLIQYNFLVMYSVMPQENYLYKETQHIL